MESKFALDYVAQQIQTYDKTLVVHTYTYGFALDNRVAINKIIKGNTLMTHSSGAMVIALGAMPSRAIFISPSQPISRPKLFMRALIKTLYHSVKIIRFSQRSKVLRILLSNISELFLHPVRNLKPFVNGDVSRFDLRATLPRHPVARGTRVLISSRDEMFTKKENKLSELHEHGVEVVEVDAMHDEIFIDTRKIIQTALKR